MIIKSFLPEFKELFFVNQTEWFLEELFLFFRTGNFPDEIKKDWEKRPGGGLCIFGKEQYEVQLWSTIGKIPPEKENKYIFYSREKGERLFSHLSEGHVTSYESQNIEKKEFGGAIFAKGKRFSFSGAPEVRDRADSILMLSLAVKSEQLHLQEAIRISKEILKTDNFQNFCEFLDGKYQKIFPS